MQRLFFLTALPFITSCSYVYPIGQVGPKQFIKVQAASLSGPTQTMIVIIDTNSPNEVTMLSPMGGNGILASAAVAGSIVGGSYFIGKGLEKSKGDSTTVNANASAESASQSQAEANSASSPVINIPDAPQGPPFPRRPPYKWGHHK